jgi:hypothetical protein
VISVCRSRTCFGASVGPETVIRTKGMARSQSGDGWFVASNMDASHKEEKRIYMIS